MSEFPNANNPNQISDQLLTMNNLLGENDDTIEQNQNQNTNQDQIQFQVQDLNLKQNQNNTQNLDQSQTQNQDLSQNQNQTQSLDESQTQNKDQDQTQDQTQENYESQEEKKENEEEDPTKNIFATNNDNIDLLLPNENSNENLEQSNQNDNKITTKSQFLSRKISQKKPFSKPKHAVLTFLDDKPKVEKKMTLESLIHVQNPTHNFTPEEISQAADAYLQSDKIQLDDPMVVSEIIEELTSRYIDLLSKNEYIQAQNILNKIQYLRDQFRTKDAVLFMEKHLEELKTKKASLENDLKSIRTVWKEKQKQQDEAFKKESEELQLKQQEQWDKMEHEWNDPSRQRKYSKESKTLLLGRAAERYMVLAGDLEGAEMMKRKNKLLEKVETAEAYSEMTNDFENARLKLTRFFEKQEDELEEQHRMKKISLKNDESDEVQLVRKKIDILGKMIAEESNPIYKEKKIIHSRLTNSAELPMLQRTAQNIRDKNKLFMKTAQITTKPLQLPPLKMVPRPQKKAKSSLARPIAH